jgi:hypothetical protein
MDRAWSKYNKTLIKRGEFYLSFDFIEHWEKELDDINKNKRGSPYEFPHSFIEFSSFVKCVFNLPFRQLQGVCNKLSLYVPGLHSADYTTLWRRVRAIEYAIPQQPPPDNNESESENEFESENGIVVAIDATGMKVTNRGEWMREKWKKRRGWIKVHIAVNAHTKELLGIEVTDEGVGDSKELENLVEQAEHTVNKRKIERVLADAAHDTKANFNFLKQKNIQSGIKVRKNASTRSRGSPYRAQCVRELRKIGYKKWKDKYQYGMRWASEGYFSAVKRIFKEDTRATSKEGMVQEVMMKFLFYNVLAQME